MNIECPKCHYIRQPRDFAPEYECPQCGIIYAKFKPREKPNMATPKREPAPVADRGTWGVRPSIAFLGGFFACVALALTAFSLWSQRSAEQHVAAVPARQVRSAPRPEAKWEKTADELRVERERDLMSAARSICSDRIVKSATFQSSVDIQWFSNTSTKRVGTTTVIAMGFSALSTNGATLPFWGHCVVGDDGKLLYFNVVPR